jgi:hypothetical protein
VVLFAADLRPTVRRAAALLKKKERGEKNVTIKTNVKAGGVSINPNQTTRQA